VKAERSLEFETFQRMMRLIPESSVRAMELQVILAKYEADLRRVAEANLVKQGEPLTEETLNAEMARLDRENAHAIALNLDQLIRECERTSVLTVAVKHHKSGRVKHG